MTPSMALRSGVTGNSSGCAVGERGGRFGSLLGGFRFFAIDLSPGRVPFGHGLLGHDNRDKRGSEIPQGAVRCGLGVRFRRCDSPGLSSYPSEGRRTPPRARSNGGTILCLSSAETAIDMNDLGTSEVFYREPAEPRGSSTGRRAGTSSSGSATEVLIGLP